METAVKIVEVTKPLIDNELLFQLKRGFDRKHNMYIKNELVILHITIQY